LAKTDKTHELIKKIIFSVGLHRCTYKAIPTSMNFNSSFCVVLTLPDAFSYRNWSLSQAGFVLWASSIPVYIVPCTRSHLLSTAAHSSSQQLSFSRTDIATVGTCGSQRLNINYDVTNTFRNEKATTASRKPPAACWHSMKMDLLCFGGQFVRTR